MKKIGVVLLEDECEGSKIIATLLHSRGSEEVIENGRKREHRDIQCIMKKVYTQEKEKSKHRE